MHTLKINKGRETLELGPRTDGVYPVLSSSLNREGLSLVISPSQCAAGVENLDQSSDWADCFGLSCRVSVDGCEIGTGEMRAKNLDLLQVALNKVAFVARDAEDI